MDGVLFAVCPGDHYDKTVCGFTTVPTWPYFRAQLEKDFDGSSVRVKRLMWVPTTRMAESMLLSALATYHNPRVDVCREESSPETFCVTDMELQIGFDSVAVALIALSQSNKNLGKAINLSSEQHMMTSFLDKSRIARQLCGTSSRSSQGSSNSASYQSTDTNPSSNFSSIETSSPTKSATFGVGPNDDELATKTTKMNKYLEASRVMTKLNRVIHKHSNIF